jgi:hypothetical protein
MRWSDVGPDAVARVRALSERRLTPEEWAAYVTQPVGAEEHEETESLLAWFARKYPTPADRLRYARQAYRRWRLAAVKRTPEGGAT